MPIVTKEDILDRISELLIERFATFSDAGKSISQFQKVVRDGKVVTAGEENPRTSDDKLVLYGSDLKANFEDSDLIDHIYTTYFQNTEHDLNSIELAVQTDELDVNTFFKLQVAGQVVTFQDDDVFEDNLGQFVDFEEISQPFIDSDKAAQVLDTNIFELLPSVTTRQQLINDFFLKYNTLKPPSPKTFGAISDEDGDDLTETFNADSASLFSQTYDISNSPPDQEKNKSITWLQANEDYENTAKSLEWLHDDLNQNYFLQHDIEAEIEDDRPKYVPKSEGYLKIRDLNQAIIIRNEESDDVGLIGPDPENPLWLDKGFTITMWVKFLDKTSGGTLFNFGNPLRKEDPKGFMLETYTVKAVGENGYISPQYMDNTGYSWRPTGSFADSDTERFIRLVVRDKDGHLRDSHVGGPDGGAGRPQIFPEAPILERRYTGLNYNGVSSTFGSDPIQHGRGYVFSYTRVPVDLQEWYFIVANYNPSVDEDGSDFVEDNSLNQNPDYWRWNVDANGTYVSYSGFGAQCKVEIISRSDLLRARGFRP